MRLVYAPRFFERLREIRGRIANDNPPAARQMVRRIREAVRRLAATPGLGRAGRVPGTRELVVSGTPYLVPYRVGEGAVEIITVLHGAQEWPDSFP